MFKVNNKETRMTPIVNFEHISHLVLVFLLLTLNIVIVGWDSPFIVWLAFSHADLVPELFEEMYKWKVYELMKHVATICILIWWQAQLKTDTDFHTPTSKINRQ